MRSIGLFIVSTLLLGCGKDETDFPMSTLKYSVGGSAGIAGSNQGGNAGDNTGGTQSDGGTSGNGGFSGFAGSGGIAGNGGIAGSAGNSGTGGASGNSGMGGTSGMGGNGGVAGSSGMSGIGGIAGTSGTSGNSGNAGTGGSNICNVNNCPSPTQQCFIAVCTIDNACGFSSSPKGTICAGGTCDGNGQCNVCNPGDVKCAGNNVESCGNNGQWNEIVCSGDMPICLNGMCNYTTNCNELYQAGNIATGKHTMDPYGNGSTTDFWCDMSFDGGGWTMFYSTVASNACASPGYVGQNISAYIPNTLVKFMANDATQISIRITGSPDTQSVTSKPGTSPILNLRAGKLLDINFSINDWNGPMATNNILANDPNNPISGSYPDLWWANNNPTGLEIGTDRDANGNVDGSPCVAYWDGNNGNENFEAYFR